MKKILLIDIDETITHDLDYDWPGFVELVLRDLLMEKHGIDADTALGWVERMEKRTPGIGRNPFYAVRCFDMGIDAEEYYKKVMEVAKNRLTVFEDTVRTIKELRKAGYVMFIASNNCIDRAMMKLTIAGLATNRRTTYFEHIYGRDILCRSKDDPLFYKEILERENLSGDEVVMIGDDEKCDGHVPLSAGITNSVIINRTQKYPVRKDVFYRVNTFTQVIELMNGVFL